MSQVRRADVPTATAGRDGVCPEVQGGPRLQDAVVWQDRPGAARAAAAAAYEGTSLIPCIFTSLWEKNHMSGKSGKKII